MNHRRKLSFFVSALILISILNLSSIPAATVSHTASQITAGTLGAGNYTFPENVIVNGNVGIGTASPTQKLEVNGNINISNASGILYTPQICLAGDCQTSWPSGGDGVSPWDNSSTQIFVRSGYPNYVNASDTLFVNGSSGNVGIGTTDPQQALNVVGDANVTGTIYAHNYSANSPITFVNSTGGVIMIMNDAGNMNLTGNLTVFGSLNGINISTLGAALPIGSVVQYVGAAAPDGFFLCDGSSYSRTAYADLYAAIETTYGNTSSTTFKVPDFRGVFPKGAGTQGTASWASANYASTVGNYSQDKEQGHYTTISDSGHTHAQYISANCGLGSPAIRVDYQADCPGGTAIAYAQGINTALSYTGITATTPINDGTNGVPRTGTTTEPASLGINYIIKAFNPTSINTSSNSVIGGNLTVNGNMYVGSGRAYGQAYRTTTFTLPSQDVWNDIPLDGGDNNMVNTAHSTVTNPAQINVTYAGVYKISYKIIWGTVATNAWGRRSVRIYKNGVSAINGSATSTLVSGSWTYQTLTNAVIVSLAAGDYITLQGNGADEIAQIQVRLEVFGTDTSALMTIEKIGEV